jgi:hypothetical protein
MKLKSCFLLFFGATLISSCGAESLEQVKALEEISSDLKTLGEEVSSDIYASCTRSAMWESLSTVSSREVMQAQLDVCTGSYGQIAENSKVAGGVLTDYYSALLSLAGGSNPSVSTQLDEVSEALGGLSIGGVTISDNARSAGVKIAELITNFLLGEYRRESVTNAVICTDSDIQVYSDNFSDFVRYSYVDYLLKREIQQINEYYSYFATQLNLGIEDLPRTPENFPEIRSLYLLQTSLEEKEREEISKVVERQEKGLAYIFAIQATADYHNSLKVILNSGQGELSSQKTQECEIYFATGATNKIILGDTNKLSGKVENESLELIQEATEDYIQSVSEALSGFEED